MDFLRRRSPFVRDYYAPRGQGFLNIDSAQSDAGAILANKRCWPDGEMEYMLFKNPKVPTNVFRVDSSRYPRHELVLRENYS